MPRTINDAQQHDRAEFPEQHIGQQRSQQRRQIHRANEPMVVFIGLRLDHRRTRHPVHQVEIAGHEGDQNRPHPVKRKAFGGFIADDPGNPRRHPVGLNRGRTVGHAVYLRF
jgi:hypothetical protein